jgi:hypothetical protein
MDASPPNNQDTTVTIEKWWAFASSGATIKWSFVKIKFDDSRRAYRKMIGISDETGKKYQDLPNDIVIDRTKVCSKVVELHDAEKDTFLKDFATGDVETLDNY